MRKVLISAGVLAVVAAAPVAHAEITITRAEYVDGMLFVRGETSRANQLVVLDGRYQTRTDQNKEFRLHIRYLPPGCGVTIRAGQEQRPARVANCDRDQAPPSGTERTTERPGQAQPETHMRVVRRSCSSAGCRVLCGEREFAVNAFCAGGEATLVDERTVACKSANSGEIVAYCLGPATVDDR